MDNTQVWQKTVKAVIYSRPVFN